MNILQKSYIRNYSGKKKKQYSYTNRKDRSYHTLLIALLLFCLLSSTVLSILLGATKLSLTDLFSVLFGQPSKESAFQIVHYVRLPRTVAAVMAGAALSVSGLILQTVLNNSLASPNIIGVNAGAGLAVVAISALFPGYYIFSAIAAFLGAILAMFIIYLLAVKGNATKLTIILSGIAASSFFGAITDTLLTLYPEAILSRQAFLIGGFNGVSIRHLTFAGFFIVPALLTSLLIGHRMNLLALGDELAHSLGLNIKLTHFILLFLAAVLSGGTISFAGLIGFVGLITPHLARALVGYHPKVLLPVCILLGSNLTLSCDLIARTLFAPYEVPVGILLSFLGGPFFLIILYKKRRYLNV